MATGGSNVVGDIFSEFQVVDVFISPKSLQARVNNTQRYRDISGKRSTVGYNEKNLFLVANIFSNA